MNIPSCGKEGMHEKKKWGFLVIMAKSASFFRARSPNG
jgi:hypothetical protein